MFGFSSLLTTVDDLQNTTPDNIKHRMWFIIITSVSYLYFRIWVLGYFIVNENFKNLFYDFMSNFKVVSHVLRLKFINTGK